MSKIVRLKSKILLKTFSNNMNKFRLKIKKMMRKIKIKKKINKKIILKNPLIMKMNSISRKIDLNIAMKKIKIKV